MTLKRSEKCTVDGAMHRGVKDRPKPPGALVIHTGRNVQDPLRVRPAPAHCRCSRNSSAMVSMRSFERKAFCDNVQFAPKPDYAVFTDGVTDGDFVADVLVVVSSHTIDITPLREGSCGNCGRPLSDCGSRSVSKWIAIRRTGSATDIH